MRDYHFTHTNVDIVLVNPNHHIVPTMRVYRIFLVGMHACVCACEGEECVHVEGVAMERVSICVKRVLQGGGLGVRR